VQYLSLMIQSIENVANLFSTITVFFAILNAQKMFSYKNSYSNFQIFLPKTDNTILLLSVIKTLNPENMFELWEKISSSFITL